MPQVTAFKRSRTIKMAITGRRKSTSESSGRRVLKVETVRTRYTCYCQLARLGVRSDPKHRCLLHVPIQL